MSLTEADALASRLEAFIEESVAKAGGNTSPVAPSHRVPFHWPPHPVSKDYHTLASDWTGKAQIELYGEVYDVQLARTAQGLFGRIERVWNEAKGTDVDDVLKRLAQGAEPYFQRQMDIGTTLGRGGRFTGTYGDLT